jgi:glycosyltransferase involved in cell wall biosynthesis
LKVLFLSEGALGTVMGHASYDGAIAPTLQRTAEVESRFIGLPRQSRALQALSRDVRGLRGRDLDLQTLRWHVIHALLARKALKAELEDFDPDVVHVRSHVITFGLIDYMKRIPIVPVVDVTTWDWRAMGIWRPVRRHSRAMLWPSELAERRAFSGAALVLAMSGWTEASIKRSAPAARVVRHHPGINLEIYRPAEPADGDRPLRVLFVGARFERKGGMDLVNVLEGRLGKDVELDVVTREGVPYQPGIRTHVLDTNDPRLVELYQQADVMCLPTYGDATPWAVLEAMACGTPVISTDIGGISELLDGGNAGVLVRPGDRDGLRRELFGLLDDEQRRRELGARARAYVEESYDAAKQGAILLELLSDVSKRRP